MRKICCQLLVIFACGWCSIMSAVEPANQPSVFDAASTGDLTIVSNFVAQGGDVNLRDDRPLRGYTLLMCAIEGQSAEICKFLLSKGARVNAHSKAGITALIIAKQKYEMSLPQYYEKRIVSAQQRLATVKKEKYQEATKKRLELYKKQYEEADTSKEAQDQAKMIVEMLEEATKEQKFQEIPRSGIKNKLYESEQSKPTGLHEAKQENAKSSK